MKRVVYITLGLVAVLWGAAWFVPGFWTMVPANLRDNVPASMHAALNVPAAQPAAAPRPAGGRGPGGGGGAGGGQGRPTPVTTGVAERKSLPVRVESVGAVQTIASVSIRPRVDSQITEILFNDGAPVKEGDILVKLDSRAIEAQIRQAEATVALNRANLDLARRTLRRGEELADQNFATKQRLDENRSAVAAQEAQLRANEAALDNLKTQSTYYTIRAPLTGKAGVAALKPGNIAQAAAAATAITTINQIAPIYVSFALPQAYFHELRDAIAKGEGNVEATPQGGGKPARGKLTLVDNAIDNATGTIGVRATFPNADEALWPGAIVNVRVDLRMENNVVAVPREAVQMGQRGHFVFVVREGIAKMQPVTVGRGIDKETIITAGLNGGEVLIVDGHLLVNDGGRVTPRVTGQNAAGASAAGQNAAAPPSAEGGPRRPPAPATGG